VVPGLIEDTFPVKLRENLLIGNSGFELLKKHFSSDDRPIPFFNPYPQNYEDHLEEERRLFFVAITRAQEGIILTSPKRIEATDALVSPFLKEIELKPTVAQDYGMVYSLGEVRVKLASMSPEELSSLRKALGNADSAWKFGSEILLEPRSLGEHTIDKIRLPDDFVFSAQALKDYLDCQRRFYFLRILRIREPKEESNEYLVFGNAVHRCLAQLHSPRGPWENGKTFEDSDLEAFIHETETSEFEILDPLTKFIKREELRRTLSDYREAVFRLEQLPSKGTHKVEENFFFELEGFRCVAKFDRVLESQGGIWIVDYKTGSRLSSSKLAEAAFPEETIPTEIQIPFYLLALRKTIDKPVAAMTLYVSDGRYQKKCKAFSKGFLASAALNLGTGPDWGHPVTQEEFERFEKMVVEILKKIRDDPVFDCKPSNDPKAPTCVNRRSRKCEFLPFCQERIDNIADFHDEILEGNFAEDGSNKAAE